MPARLHRLRTKPQRLQQETAARLRQTVLDFPGLPEQAVSQIVAAIDRVTAPDPKWTFVMLSPAQNEAVQRWLVENAKRPLKATILWAVLFKHLDQNTGEIDLSRDELAEAIGATPDHVSEIMRELEGIGAISRRRVRVPGMRGPGMVRYFMNPNVATHIKGRARDNAQAAMPEVQAAPVRPPRRKARAAAPKLRVVPAE